MILVNVQDEWTFSTLTFMKNKLQNCLTTHLELVVGMKMQNFYTLENFPYGDGYDGWAAENKHLCDTEYVFLCLNLVFTVEHLLLATIESWKLCSSLTFNTLEFSLGSGELLSMLKHTFQCNGKSPCYASFQRFLSPILMSMINSSYFLCPSFAHC